MNYTSLLSILDLLTLISFLLLLVSVICPLNGTCCCGEHKDRQSRWQGLPLSCILGDHEQDNQSSTRCHAGSHCQRGPAYAAWLLIVVIPGVPWVLQPCFLKNCWLHVLWGSCSKILISTAKPKTLNKAQSPHSKGYQEHYPETVKQHKMVWFSHVTHTTLCISFRVP